MIKAKVKVTLVQALLLCTGRTAHRGSGGIALPFHDHGTRRGEGSASRPGRSLPPGKARYPLYRRQGAPQGRSGQVRKISPPTGIRSPDRPACSQSLYRLSCRGPLKSRFHQINTQNWRHSVLHRYTFSKFILSTTLQWNPPGDKRMPLGNQIRLSNSEENRSDVLCKPTYLPFFPFIVPTGIIHSAVRMLN